MVEGESRELQVSVRTPARVDVVPIGCALVRASQQIAAIGTPRRHPGLRSSQGGSEDAEFSSDKARVRRKQGAASL